MAREIEIDLTRFVRDLERAGNMIGESARESVHDIMDDWKYEAINLAPVDTTALRRSIHYRTERKGVSGVNVTGEIRAKAIEVSRGWGNFDYAYYIHEIKGDSFRGHVPGTVGRFLDIPAEQHETEWIQMIEDDIKRKIREAGF